MNFMPHGMCFSWQPDVLTLHVISDAFIALAYFSIPPLLVWFVRRRADLPFRPVFGMFGTFIVACGLTHVMAIWTIWHPDYWVDGAFKALTALASIGTAVALVPLLPRALALRSPRELERLNAELAETVARYEREHYIAQTLQTASLAMLPDVDGLIFSAMYAPGVSDLEVGGDWYDAFTLDDGRVALTIGDVTGKGLSASIIMAKVRQSLRSAAQLHVDPSSILDAADRALRGEYPDRVVTAFVAIFDRLTATLTYANAGHPWPMVRRADGTVVELRHVALPLGLRERNAAPSAYTTLGDGDMLVLYTDGLVEATRDVIVGERALRQAVETIDLLGEADAANILARAVLGSHDVRDDVAIMTVTVVNAAALPEGAEQWRFDVRDVAAASAARHAYRVHLRGYGLAEPDVVSAELVFSELLGNVFRHAPGDVAVMLDTSGSHAVLHVLDRGPGFVHVARLPDDVFSERGRGLFLIASLTEDFHISRRPDGGSHARVVLARAPVLVSAP